MSYKAGCENPAHSEHVVNGIVNKVIMAKAAMAGSLTRKIPEQNKAGQNVAGEANQVEISFKSKSPGKKTWEGSSDGYTTKSVPSYVASPANSSGSDTPSKSQSKGKQTVKGKQGSKAPSESKPVSGRSRI